MGEAKDSSILKSEIKFLIDNNITELEGILKFNLEGYSYSESETNKLNQPVFVR